MAAFDPRVFVGSLTQRPGTYQMLDGKGRVIYVGKARNLRRRVASYFGGRPQDAKTMAMVARIADIRVTVTATEADALMLEYNLIKRHKPRFNVVLRDDKSYPYIRVRTDREFPQVSFYRGSRRAAGRCSVRIPAPARSARPSANCRSSSRSANAKTAISPTVSAPACNTRSGDVPHRAWDW